MVQLGPWASIGKSTGLIPGWGTDAAWPPLPAPEKEEIQMHTDRKNIFAFEWNESKRF